jgi:hypothetical protein
VKSFFSIEEKGTKAMSDRWIAGESEGRAMKKFILSAMLAFTLATGTVVAASIPSGPAYAGCGCQP